ncbi:MAG TPA: metallophosphoesterase [Fibrobacteraceae bacterium]|nr:metallophosphoesterase [Fibrobacteraceae bacterium]
MMPHPFLLIRILALLFAAAVLRYLWIRMRILLPRRSWFWAGIGYVFLCLGSVSYRLLPVESGWLGMSVFALGGWGIVFLGNWLIVCLILELGNLVHSGLRQHWTKPAMLLTIATTAVFFSYGWIHQLHFQVHHEIVHSQKPMERPLRLAVISDVHFDPLFRPSKFDRLLDSLKQQKPDMILLLGDLTDLSIPDMERMNLDLRVRRLHAPLGVWGITGNHEAYRLSRDPDLLSWMRKQGIRLLVDESVCLPQLCLTGRMDRQFATHQSVQRKSLPQLVDSAMLHQHPWIVLDHEPLGLDSLDRPVGFPLPDLGLSGHTHAGQFFPWTLVIHLFWPLANGRGELDGIPWITSSGFGQWGPPVRVGCNTELLIVDLEP